MATLFILLTLLPITILSSNKPALISINQSSNPLTTEVTSVALTQKASYHSLSLFSGV